MEKLEIAGVSFDNCTMQEAVNRCREFLDGERCSMIVTPNAEIGYTCMVDKEIEKLVNSAQMVIPDGSGVVLGAKILNMPLKEQVAGADLAQNLLTLLTERGESLYLLGGKPGVAELAAQRIKQRYPELKIAGTQDGYFKEEMPVVQAIRESGASVLFVCLGFPKQEQFISRYREELGVRIAIGLGGTLDVLAGVVKRAPAIFRKLHIEFLYRLMKEPRRFGRMMRIPKYLWRLACMRITGKD